MRQSGPSGGALEAVTAFSRLPTGIKMLLILSGALLPLGLIAIFASLESARTNHLTREAGARMMAAESARQLSTTISAATFSLRRVVAGFEGAVPDPAACARALQSLAGDEQPRARYALYDNRRRRICASPGFLPLPLRSPSAQIGTEVQIVAGGKALRFALQENGIFAAGELTSAAVLAISRPRLASARYTLGLRQGDLTMPLVADGNVSPLAEAFTVLSPVAGGQLALEMAVNARPIGALEILPILLPLLMWMAAATLGWLVVDRLLLRPLAQMQKAIGDYGVGAGPLLIPAMTTPAQEIRGLGEAFRDVTERLAQHEANLEEGLARQTKLTREVHHRVKNNLQVVASLINIHSRAARSEEAADAYASIQRRVDALAVVHRNHYAELEDNQGVGLRSLIGELASNLRATASAEAARFTIALDIMPASALQDVAVPVAFLITELVELAMLCEPGGGVEIGLYPVEDRTDSAQLQLVAAGLSTEACAQQPSFARFQRVVDGLARQLRAPLGRDDATGTYTIRIRILPQPPLSA